MTEDTDRTTEPKCIDKKGHIWTGEHEPVTVETGDHGTKKREMCSICKLEKFTFSWIETRERTRTIYVPGLHTFINEREVTTDKSTWDKKGEPTFYKKSGER